MDTKRFNNPEYKKQIKAVRTYRREVKTTPETRIGKFFYILGLGSVLSKILVILVLALLVYLTYFAQFLWIKDYDLRGLDDSARQTVLSDLQDYERGYKYLLPQKNIIFFNVRTFSAYLLTHNQQIAKVNSVQKKLWHTLILDLDQRVPAFTLQIGTKSYILNSDGSIGQEADPLESAQYPIILDTASEQVVFGEHFFTEQQNSFLRYIQENFEKEIGVQIKSYSLPGKASDQLTVFSEKGFKVLFANNTDPNLYLERLKSLWLQFTPDQQNRLVYLDLRFEKNAYGCFRDEVCAQ